MKERYYIYNCSATKEQMNELNNHLKMNGYNFSINEKKISIHEEETDYVETIMNDRGINYTLDDVEWLYDNEFNEIDLKVQTIVCNCCNKEIPKATKKDIDGIEKEFYEFGKLNFGRKVFNSADFNEHGIILCERCAEKINFEIQRIKMETMIGI